MSFLHGWTVTNDSIQQKNHSSQLFASAGERGFDLILHCYNATCHSFTGELSRMIPYNKMNHSAQLLASAGERGFDLLLHCYNDMSFLHGWTVANDSIQQKNHSHNYSLLLVSEVLTYYCIVTMRHVIPSRVNCREWFHTTKRMIAHNYSLLLVSEVLTYYASLQWHVIPSRVNCREWFHTNKKNHLAAQLLASAGERGFDLLLHCYNRDMSFLHGWTVANDSIQQKES